MHESINDALLTSIYRYKTYLIIILLLNICSCINLRTIALLSFCIMLQKLVRLVKQDEKIFTICIRFILSQTSLLLSNYSQARSKTLTLSWSNIWWKFWLCYQTCPLLLFLVIFFKEDQTKVTALYNSKVYVDCWVDNTFVLHKYRGSVLVT